MAYSKVLLRLHVRVVPLKRQEDRRSTCDQDTKTVRWMCKVIFQMTRLGVRDQDTCTNTVRWMCKAIFQMTGLGVC